VRIAYLTTCLEPGRDGVGDYTWGLAEECAGLGHEVFRMALNDPYAESALAESSYIRLGASMAWEGRIAKARQALEEFAPDFISLQFVCYGFHPRGVDWRLADHLKEIVGNIPLQMMFHELWIGSDIGAVSKTGSWEPFSASE